MEITEVQIKLVQLTHDNERLLAYCSVTFDDAFVVHDLKLLDKAGRGVFVSMPSRKMTDKCFCGNKNHLRASFCNQCGRKLGEGRALRDANGRAKLHADTAHPINAVCRNQIQRAVIRAYEEERRRSKPPSAGLLAERPGEIEPDVIVESGGDGKEAIT